VDVVDASHPSTSMLPAEWHVQDEMLATNPMNYRDYFRGLKSVCRYDFKSDPRSLGAVVVLSANESSYSGLPGFTVASCVVSDTHSQTLALISSIRGLHIR